MSWLQYSLSLFDINSNRFGRTRPASGSNVIFGIAATCSTGLIPTGILHAMIIILLSISPF